MSQSIKQFVYGLESDTGMSRTNNEDSAFGFLSASRGTEAYPNFGLFVVADGMGGHLHGERASAIGMRTITDYLMNHFFLELSDNPFDRPVISEILTEAINTAHAKVLEQVSEGGTTVVVAAIVNDLAHVAYVGDSRAYLITSENIEQLTHDHSLVQRLVDLSQITLEEAKEHPKRNVLYSALGQGEAVEIGMATRRLVPGAWLLLCCDGLWGQVDESDIKAIILASKSPQEACKQLIDAANDRGGLDNITAVLVQLQN